MTQTQPSDQTESSESSLLSDWKSKLPKTVKVFDNTKLYYRKYGHVLTISKDVNWRDHKEHSTWRANLYQLKAQIDKALDGEYSVRMEWTTLRVFTNDIAKVLSILPRDVIKRHLDSIGVMRDDVRTSLMKKPETYKSVYTIVKKLPFNQYRHKIYYVCDARHKRIIGKEALEAISHQIAQTPGVKWTPKHQKNCTTLNHHWDATYFYSTDLDWMPMVMLIDPRFIKKIEHIKLESEIE